MKALKLSTIFTKINEDSIPMYVGPLCSSIGDSPLDDIWWDWWATKDNEYLNIYHVVKDESFRLGHEIIKEDVNSISTIVRMMVLIDFCKQHNIEVINDVY